MSGPALFDLGHTLRGGDAGLLRDLPLPPVVAFPAAVDPDAKRAHEARSCHWPVLRLVRPEFFTSNT